MEALGVVVGVVVGVLTIITLILVLMRRLSSAVEEIAHDVLLDVGLIKRVSKEEPGSWPNGSDNLPDFLRYMWESQESMQAQLYKLCKDEE